jgi:hypothetical protein
MRFLFAALLASASLSVNAGANDRQFVERARA